MTIAMDPRLSDAIFALDNAKKTNIKGKDYATVATRVEIFRKVMGFDWAIVTDVIDSGDPDIVRIKCTIADPMGRIVANGHAQEDRTMNKINETSSLEVAETSAIGRALACLGFMGGEYASAFEMEFALKEPPPKVAATRTPRARTKELAEIRDNIADTFPAEIPSMDQYTFMVPERYDEQGIDVVFAEIERIQDPAALTAFWKRIKPDVEEQVAPDLVKEIKSTLKERSAELKGQ